MLTVSFTYTLMPENHYNNQNEILKKQQFNEVTDMRQQWKFLLIVCAV